MSMIQTAVQRMQSGQGYWRSPSLNEVSPSFQSYNLFRDSPSNVSGLVRSRTVPGLKRCDLIQL